MYVTQEFRQVKLYLTNDDNRLFTDEEKEFIRKTIFDKVLDYQAPIIIEDYIDGSDAGLDITIGDGKNSFRDVDVTVTPGYPATRWEPAEDAELDGYYETARDLIYECLKDFPDAWDMDILEDDFDDIDTLWSKTADLDDGPDPDQAYEEYRDRMLFGDDA